MSLINFLFFDFAFLLFVSRSFSVLMFVVIVFFATERTRVASAILVHKVGKYQKEVRFVRVKGFDLLVVSATKVVAYFDFYNNFCGHP